MKQKLLQISLRALLLLTVYLLFSSCEWNLSISQWHVYSRIAFAYAITQSLIVDIPYGRKV